MRKIILIAGIALIVGTLTVVTEEQHRSVEKYEMNRHEDCLALANSSEETHACDRDAQSRRDYAPWWYGLISWPGGITTWAVIATGFAIAWQSWETRRAAKSSRDAIILQHRPKIVVRKLGLILKESGEFEIELILRNSGATTATIDNWIFGIWWMRVGQQNEVHTRPVPGMILKPGEPRTLMFTVPEFYVRFEASRLILEQNPGQEQEVFLTCIGVLSYRDEIGTRRDTAITRHYVFRERRFVIAQNLPESDYSD